ncbi:MAG TPA: hypothetical protein PLS85_10715, partial [Chitinophagales bacterium]|nr:hypothetical protein [Chitinophagales bacterium]
MEDLKQTILEWIINSNLNEYLNFNNKLLDFFEIGENVKFEDMISFHVYFKNDLYSQNYKSQYNLNGIIPDIFYRDQTHNIFIEFGHEISTRNSKNSANKLLCDYSKIFRYIEANPLTMNIQDCHFYNVQVLSIPIGNFIQFQNFGIPQGYGFQNLPNDNLAQINNYNNLLVGNLNLNFESDIINLGVDNIYLNNQVRNLLLHNEN